jgi:hypothetical protein
MISDTRLLMRSDEQEEIWQQDQVDFWQLFITMHTKARADFNFKTVFLARGALVSGNEKDYILCSFDQAKRLCEE